jgi:hypothetical protein
MPILYKYVEPDKDTDGTAKPIRILETMRLSATDPRWFNLKKA